MKTILRFDSHFEYKEWESKPGNCIHTIQDSDSKIIGEMKEEDLMHFWEKGQIVSLENPRDVARKRFVEMNFKKEFVCDYGIVNKDDKEVLSKLLHIEIER